ncbi:(2Fe-2S)-binding protein [Streptomyces sp. NBC_01803]|uniref:(2Fe-2S)-binding protein n=1 Tax=Streptomyces sp. NBC_01803 TaxID=2975946 RepID=UPI002DD7F50C|nr:(2Fe-2S)-binding protein [Streptomyces sp. NBC_01803]WSA44080.1 (2Fe-2S)-binding protein [Streptomyces sp. NBC_01803]
MTDGLAAFGAFFALRTHPAHATPVPPWRPMGELAREPTALRDRVEAVRGGLAALNGREPDGIELRVAASIAHLGLVARLLSPALVLAVLQRRHLASSLGALWWQPVLGGPVPLSAPAEPVLAPAPASGPADLLHDCLTDGPVGELTSAFRALRISPRVLWGNVASALHSSAVLTASARPDLAAGVRALTAALLARPPLRDTARTTAEGRFQRRSCCLIYRTAPGPAGPVCGDCVLAARG